MKRKLPWIYPVFLLLLLFPAYAWLFDGAFTLQGVSEGPAAVAVSAESLLSGETQQQAEAAYAAAMPGRNLLIRLRNQSMFTLLHTAPNGNQVLSEDGHLFAKEYLQNYYNAYPPMTEEEMRALVDRLESLQALLREDFRDLYIFITPSKARYVDPPAAWQWMIGARAGTTASPGSDYDLFLRCTEGTSLKIYDSIRYIDKHRDDFDFPLFYRSGIHWSNALGNTVAADFIKWLARKSSRDLNTYKVTMEPAEEPKHPDSDLMDTLNLFFKPAEEYVKPKIRTKSRSADQPSVFLRGGSFMGQSLSMLIRKQAFGADVHFENNYILSGRYTSEKFISGFTAYDEADLPSLLSGKEFIILEVNESKFRDMGFGFIEYLLAHPECLHGPAGA